MTKIYHGIIICLLVLKENLKKIDKILEIGTHYGRFTNFLSEIFPNSQIISIDLNENDQSFISSYDREDSKKLSKFLEVRKIF